MSDGAIAVGRQSAPCEINGFLVVRRWREAWAKCVRNRRTIRLAQCNGHHTEVVVRLAVLLHDDDSSRA